MLCPYSSLFRCQVASFRKSAAQSDLLKEEIGRLKFLHEATGKQLRDLTLHNQKESEDLNAKLNIANSKVEDLSCECQLSRQRIAELQQDSQNAKDAVQVGLSCDIQCILGDPFHCRDTLFPV